MNAVLNIQVRVAARQANRELRQTAGNVGAVGAAGAAASAGGMAKFQAGIHKSLGLMQRWGKNLQWIGRQLEFNFTLPIAAAGFFATKWALENEKAMTQVRKVYGDMSFSADQVKRETDALAESFELLSSRFGEHQQEVIDVGAAWAAAGSAGVGLAKNVRNTLEAAILGDFDLEEATEALIATMSAFGLTADEMREQLSLMNIIENETAVQMEDLIVVLQRAGGAARSSGVNIRYLSAMAAQLIPATGEARRAGSALRTMMSRLMSPTTRAADELNRMGLEVDTLGWTSLNFVGRMERMAEAWKGLVASERAFITSTIASRWQVNRFDILMQGFIDTQSFYKKSLDVSSDATQAHATYQRELQAVLESNPKRLEIMANVLKNEMSGAMVQLLPALVGFVRGIAGLAEGFGNLSPQTQKFVLAGLAFLAITGPIIRYLGASILLMSQLGEAVYYTARAFVWLAGQVYQVIRRIVVLIANWVVAHITGEAEATAASSAASRYRAGYAAWEAESRTAANAAAMTAITGTYGELAAASGAAASATSTTWVGAAELMAGAHTAGAIVAGNAWATAALEAGAAQAALGPATGGIAAGMAKAHTAAAGTTGSVWIAANSTIVASSMIAGTEVVAIWTGTVGGVQSAVSYLMAWLANMQLALPAAASTSAALTTGAWTGAMVEVGHVHHAGMGRAALAQGYVPAAALPAGTATVGIWGRTMAAIQAMLASRFIAPFVMAFKWILAAASKAFLGIAVFFGRYLLGPLFIGVKAIVTAIAGLLAGISAPVWIVVGIIAAAIAAIVLFFNDDLRNGIIDGLRELPRIVADTFRSVVSVIASAMRAVIEWLSYLNPFARHSPSLVDNVRAGVSTILDEYSRMSGIPDTIRAATRAHEEFNRIVGSAAGGFQQAEYAQQRQEIVTAVPGAGPAVDNLIAQINALRSSLTPIAAEIDQQAMVVARWEQALSPLEAKLRRQEAVLSDLEYQLRIVDTAMRDARDTMNELASTPIEGMRKFEDAIFDNEMAQKELRLEILKLEEAGQSIDDLNQKYSDLNGMIELLRGERESLRQAGAGSDILSAYDAEIDALKQQRDALEGQRSEIGELEDALGELQRQGEMLELEKALTFDAQLRQIEQLSRGLDEMPFDEIVAGIEAQKETLDRLQPSYDSLSAKVDSQRMAVGATRQEHDRIDAILTREQDKLDELNQAYSDIETQIREMESAMSGFAQEAQSAREAAERAASGDGRPEFGDYERPGGEAVLGAEGGLPDIEEFNRMLEEELGDVLGEFDIFEPVKNAWNSTWGWIKDSWGKITGWFRRNLSLEGIGNVFGEIGGWFASMGTKIKDVWDNWIWPVFEAIWNFVEPVLGPIFRFLWDVVSTVFDKMAKIISWWWENVSKPILEAVWGFIENFLIPIFTLFRTIAEIAFTLIARAIQWAWRNVIKFVFEAIKQWIETLGTVFGWLWRNVIRPVWNRIKDHISTMWNKFILPIFNRIKDVIENRVAPVFRWLRDNVIRPVWDSIVGIISGAWSKIGRILETAINGFINGFNLLAQAVNWVAEAVGVESRVSFMTHVDFTSGGSSGRGFNEHGWTGGGLAQGGIMTEWGKAPFAEVGDGFITNEVRAIVGEGSRHPEFVIPTDPRYRKQAMALFEKLGGALMAGGGTIPTYGFGGELLEAAKDPFGAGKDIVTGLAGEAASLASDVYGALGGARADIASITNPYVKDVGDWVLNEAQSWVIDSLKDLGKGIRNVAGNLVDAANPVDDVLDFVGLATGGQLPQNPIDMATGGIVRRRTGGTLLRLGEGRSDEKVQVLPTRTDEGDGDKYFYFNGDLSFPNITDPDDAKKFIENLEKLAS